MLLHGFVSYDILRPSPKTNVCRDFKIKHLKYTVHFYLCFKKSHAWFTLLFCEWCWSLLFVRLYYSALPVYWPLLIPWHGLVQQCIWLATPSLIFCTSHLTQFKLDQLCWYRKHLPENIIILSVSPRRSNPFIFYVIYNESICIWPMCWFPEKKFFLYQINQRCHI